MSFQAYLDSVEKQTGLTPRQLVELAAAQGFGPESKAGPVVEWLKTEHGLGHGHAQAMAQVIRKGDRISAKHVGTAGSHRDSGDRLWLDGAATRPADW